MAHKNVKVKYNYFEVCCINSATGEEELYDLRTWMNSIFEKKLIDKTHTVGEIKGRLEDILPKDDYYGLRFMRLDELSNTYKAKESKAAEHIDLEDDEYIGKSTVALYDPKLHVLMVQSNRGGFGFVTIEKYISESFGREKKTCYLRPIYNILKEGNLSKQNITKIQVRFSNTRRSNFEDSKNFSQILKGINEYYGLTANIEIGLGQKKDRLGDSLENDNVLETVQVIRKNKDNISSARITIDDDGKSKLIDIFDNVENDFINFTLPERRELGFEFMLDKMIETYEGGAKARIINLAKIRE